ncbi:MAG TPA: energy-coupling factor transporter ATPase [Dictyobacter sp.]|jgi:energy-coupling factor transport system ATP-binding protein|nr:energy-coupling factor transporter ATPase [Dictyobacter sp.]
MSNIPLIDIQQMSYTYPVEKQGKMTAPDKKTLDDINLQVQRGEYVAILGHNGSGKSTLARHCNALLLPDSGQVLVDGRDTRDPASHQYVRDRMGMIFQNPDNQLIATVVEDDVAWGLAIRGIPVQEIRARVDMALRAVNIEHLRLLAPHKLSGGQRQRVAIAGIVALRPLCIIADEATSMLDPQARQELTHVLYELHRDYGLTILHVTHLLEEVIFAQRILVMEQGRIILEETPSSLFADVEKLRALKLVVPDYILLADRLRQAGLAISQSAVTVDALAREIANE